MKSRDKGPLARQFKIANWLIGGGLVLTAFGVGLGLIHLVFLCQSGETTGTVMRMTNRAWGQPNHALAPEFRFQDQHGKTHTVLSEFASDPPAFKVGERVQVLYDPENPARARIKSFATLWLLPLGFTLFGLLFAASVAWMKRGVLAPSELASPTSSVAS